MYNLIKEICETNEWVFNYARTDFSNLYDGDEQVGDTTPLVFLDPVQITESFGDMNDLETTNYAGSMMILLSSDLDEEDYDIRYQKYIKPLINTTLNVIKDGIKCDGIYSIITWRTTEIINALDFNADGVIINYSIDE